MFSYELCEILKIAFFLEHLRWLLLAYTWYAMSDKIPYYFCIRYRKDKERILRNEMNS